jgi:hypothetical protein
MFPKKRTPHYKHGVSQAPWLTPVILATQEEEIRRIMVQSQLWQITHETLSGKKNHQKKKRAGGVAQGIGPVFKPQYLKKKKKKHGEVDAGRY